MALPRPANLDLIHALSTNDVTQVNTSSKQNEDYTIEDATGFWVRRHRGTGWLIAVVEITLSLQIQFEHSLDKTGRLNLGLLNEERDKVAQVGTHPKALVIVEADKLTPAWAVQVVQHMARQPESRLLVLHREGW